MAGQTLNADDIRSHYFGKGNNTLAAAPAAEQLDDSSEELTASARFVVRECKKRLGQRGTLESIGAETGIPDERQLILLVESIERSEDEELTEKERTAVVAALSASLEHFDILTPLLERPDVNDIIVTSYKDISIQKNRRNIQTDLRFSDHESYKSFVENLLKRAGKACTTATPVVDAVVDEHVRVCVTHQSFSPPSMGPMLTLRVSRHPTISLGELAQYELAPAVVLDYLAALIQSGLATILIGGEVGTGKTTLVKALASRIDENEAILIIEDTNELVLKRKFVRTLLTREANTEGAGKIDPALAIRTGMRMAMNRLILGEMRDAEAAEAFIDVCSSGHAGMSTIHSRSARDAISRLELFLGRAQGSVNIDTIRRQIANAVSVVVYLGLDKKQGKRRVLEVVEIGSYADGSVQISPIFSFVGSTDLPEWRRELGISDYTTVLRQNAVVLPEPGTTIGFDAEHLYRSYHQAS